MALVAPGSAYSILSDCDPGSSLEGERSGVDIRAAAYSPGGCTSYEEKVILPGPGRRHNVLSCVLNLVLCQLGLGGLTLPSTFAAVGWLQASMLIVVFFFVSLHGMFLLDKTCRALPPGTVVNTASMASVVSVVFGHAGAFALEVIMLLFSFGALTSYLGVIGVELFAALNWLCPAGAAAWLSSTLLMAIATMGVIMPLSLLPDEMVRGMAGAAGTVCMLFVMSVVIASAPWVDAWPPINACSGVDSGPSLAPVSWISGFQGLLKVAPLFIFSFNGSTAFLPIRAQLWLPQSDPAKGVGRRKVSAFMWIGQAVVLLNYELTAFAGYMTFCARTPTMVLDGYSSLGLAALIARMALALQLIASCVGCWVPLCRAALWSLLCGTGTEVAGMSRAGLTQVALLCPLLLSVVLNGSLDLPLGLTSSICLTTFMFIIPGLLAWRTKALGTSMLATAWPFLFAIFGIGVGLVCTINLFAHV